MFFETSSKTGINVDEVFVQSANIILKRIDEGYYDLGNEICGIKKSIINESEKGNKKENKKENKKDNKKENKKEIKKENKKEIKKEINRDKYIQKLFSLNKYYSY